jgi:hypothetical protein
VHVMKETNDSEILHRTCVLHFEISVDLFDTHEPQRSLNIKSALPQTGTSRSSQIICR